MTRFLTILPGIGFLCGAFYAAVNEHDMNVAYNRLMFGIGIIGGGLGIHRTYAAVKSDWAATQQVGAKLDEAHGAVVSAHEAIARTENKVDAIVAASSDSIPTMKAGPIE